jgi:hypothetical protein
VKDTQTTMTVDKTLKEENKNGRDNHVKVPANMTVEELRETIGVLNTQLQDHLQKAEQHRTMAMKAQGALEVVTQIVALKDPPTEADES